MEELTDCTGSNSSCKFSAHTKRHSKCLKFGVKNTRAPKTRTQQGFPFIGYKYPWLSKGHRGIVQSSVQPHGIWKACAQLTDWQQPSKITAAPSWREHSVIPASHTWENKNIIFSCQSIGAAHFVGGMKEGHKTYIWLRRKLRVTLKILWGYTKCLSSVPANYLRDTFFILAIFKLLGGFLVRKVSAACHKNI